MKRSMRPKNSFTGCPVKIVPCSHLNITTSNGSIFKIKDSFGNFIEKRKNLAWSQNMFFIHFFWANWISRNEVKINFFQRNWDTYPPKPFFIAKYWIFLQAGFLHFLGSNGATFSPLALGYIKYDTKGVKIVFWVQIGWFWPQIHAWKHDRFRVVMPIWWIGVPNSLVIFPLRKAQIFFSKRAVKLTV